MTDIEYLNPPVVEAVCEFILPPDTEWDITIAGLIYKEVKPDFPFKESRLANQLTVTEKNGNVSQEIKREERALFFSHEREKFIQVGNRVVSIHHLKKSYINWETSFEPVIKDVFESVKKIIDIKSLQRIGLRYINKIEIPAGRDLSDFFVFRPSVDSDLKDDIKSVIVGCVCEFQKGRDGCRLQLGDEPSSDPQKRAFLLDIDYFLKQPQSVPSDQAIKWIHEAHTRVDEIFRKSITNKLEDMFGVK